MNEIKITITSILFLSVDVICHTPKNTSDVIVTYEGHSEVGNAKPIFVDSDLLEVTTVFELVNIAKEENKEPIKKVATELHAGDTEDVIFVPNEKAVMRNGDEHLNDGDVSVIDLMNRKTLSDVLGDKKANSETEPPNKETLFVSGKNMDQEDKIENKKNEVKKKKEKLRPAVGSVDTTLKRLNCSYLDCNSTLDPVCGGKMDQNQWKYRLFLNECFFRKVNCAFRQRINRYRPVSMTNCKNVGSHYSERPFSFKPVQLPPAKSSSGTKDNPRRSFSRRSLNLEVDGQFCSHPCPSSCTDDYDPQCAVSGTGRKRVFLNHCKLDFNSCLYRVVWHRHPLSVCVGGKMADMRQNRGFIGWMQRVGIVDNRGRLVLQ